jgi:hypothetical protein
MDFCENHKKTKQKKLEKILPALFTYFAPPRGSFALMRSWVQPHLRHLSALIELRA